MKLLGLELDTLGFRTKQIVLNLVRNKTTMSESFWTPCCCQQCEFVRGFPAEMQDEAAARFTAKYGDPMIWHPTHPHCRCVECKSGPLAPKELQALRDQLVREQSERDFERTVLSAVTPMDLEVELQKWRAELDQQVRMTPESRGPRHRSVSIRLAVLLMLLTVMQPVSAASTHYVPELITAWGYALIPFLLAYLLYCIARCFGAFADGLNGHLSNVVSTWKKYTKRNFILGCASLGVSVFSTFLSVGAAWYTARNSWNAPPISLQPQAIRAQKYNKFGVLLSVVLATLMFVFAPLYGCTRVLKKFEPMMRMLEKLPYVTWLMEWLGGWFDGASAEDLMEAIPTETRAFARGEPVDTGAPASWDWRKSSGDGDSTEKKEIRAEFNLDETVQIQDNRAEDDGLGDPVHTLDSCAERCNTLNHVLYECQETGKKTFVIGQYPARCCDDDDCTCDCHLWEENLLVTILANADTDGMKQSARVGLGHPHRESYENVLATVQKLAKEKKTTRKERWLAAMKQAGEISPEFGKAFSERIHKAGIRCIRNERAAAKMAGAPRKVKKAVGEVPKFTSTGPQEVSQDWEKRAAAAMRRKREERSEVFAKLVNKVQEEAEKSIAEKLETKTPAQILQEMSPEIEAAIQGKTLDANPLSNEDFREILSEIREKKSHSESEISRPTVDPVPKLHSSENDIRESQSFELKPQSISETFESWGETISDLAELWGVDKYLDYVKEKGSKFTSHVKEHKKKYIAGATMIAGIFGVAMCLMNNGVPMVAEGNKGKTKSRRSVFKKPRSGPNRQSKPRRGDYIQSSSSEDIDNLYHVDNDDGYYRGEDDAVALSDDEPAPLGFWENPQFRDDDTSIYRPEAIATVVAQKVKEEVSKWCQTQTSIPQGEAQKALRKLRPIVPKREPASVVAKRSKAIRIARAKKYYATNGEAYALNQGCPQMIPESLLGKDKMHWRNFNQKVFKFFQDDMQVSSATSVCDKVVIPLHAVVEGATCTIQNTGATAELKSEIYPVCEDLGVIFHHGTVKADNGWKMRPPKNEMVQVLGFNDIDQDEASYGIGWTTSTGFYNAQTAPGDCGGPVIAVQDGALVGFHIAGGDKGNRFVPMTEDIAQKLKQTKSILASSLFH